MNRVYRSPNNGSWLSTDTLETLLIANSLERVKRSKFHAQMYKLWNISVLRDYASGLSWNFNAGNFGRVVGTAKSCMKEALYFLTVLKLVNNIEMQCCFFMKQFSCMLFRY